MSKNAKNAKNVTAAAPVVEQIVAKGSYLDAIGAERIVLSVEQPHIMRAMKALGMVFNAEKTDFVIPDGFTADKLVSAVAKECDLSDAITNYTDSNDVREKLVEKIQICLNLTRFLLSEHRLADIRKKLRQKMPKGTAKKASELLTHADIVSLDDDATIKGTRFVQIAKFTLSDFGIVGFEPTGFPSLAIKFAGKEKVKKGRKGKEISYDLGDLEG